MRSAKMHRREVRKMLIWLTKKKEKEYARRTGDNLNAFAEELKETMEDIEKAHKWSQQANWLSLLATIISAVSLLIKVYSQ